MMNFEFGKHYIAILQDNTQLKFKILGGQPAKIKTTDGTIMLLDSIPPYIRIIEDTGTEEN